MFIIGHFLFSFFAAISLSALEIFSFRDKCQKTTLYLALWQGNNEIIEGSILALNPVNIWCEKSLL